MIKPSVNKDPFFLFHQQKKKNWLLTKTAECKVFPNKDFFPSVATCFQYLLVSLISRTAKRELR